MTTSGVTLPTGWPSATDRERLQDAIPKTGSREQVPVHAPFSGDEVAQIPACTPSDLQTAVDRARAAQDDWADRSVEQRVGVLQQVSELVLSRQKRLMDAMQVESGKARLDAAEEVLDVAGTAHYYAGHAEDALAPEKRDGALPVVTTASEHHHPRGLVGVISPWNYPLTLAVSDALPALVAGNAVVLKPPLQTPYTALLGRKLLIDAGLPPDLFQVVPGYGPDLGPPLIEAVDFLQFTGSTETGRTVAEQAGRHLTPRSLELGGKNPLLVLEDADVERAAAGAVDGCYANAGQLCVSLERIYVHQSRYDEFLDRFVALTEQQNAGPGYGFERDVGSLISADQLQRVESAVDEARDRGATVRTGGRARPDLGPWFYEPTVLTDVPGDTRVANEETFGPVVTVEPVSSTRAAIARANDSSYGLNASVWTGDPELGRAVAKELDCGTVGVNDPYAAVWASYDAPMGGRNDSGLGRRHGHRGIHKYTDTQSIAVQRGYPVIAPPGVPNWLYSRFVLGYYRLRTRFGL
jgi:succinate-semialdehyde dehydrogenase/glutarate-semialdehyde dehydrogenase